MKVNEVLNELSKQDGLKCNELVNKLNVSQQSISGILSHLKREGKVINKDAKWYLVKHTPIVNSIIQRMNDIGYDNKAWNEGYMSALADHKVINEDEFETILEYIKEK